MVAKAFESFQKDSGKLFERAGLDPAKLGDPDARYPYRGMQRLWQHAVEETGDPSFGLVVARCWHPTSLHALGYSWMASTSLRDAMERMARYVRLVSSAATVRLVEHDQVVEFRMELESGCEPLPAYESVDAAMATLVHMCRISYGEDFNPLRVRLRRPAPADPRPFETLFRAPIAFSAEGNVLDFAKADLESHLLTSNPALAAANDRVIAEYLLRFERSSVATRVRARLIAQLPAGRVDQESVAAALHMTQRTMQRRLRREGTSYKTLLEDVRRELALEYARQAHLSVNEMTYLLGYSEPGSLSRAFKRWTGCSPSGYRAQAAGAAKQHPLADGPAGGMAMDEEVGA
jgi:AraC-like DNA-binding protein